MSRITPTIINRDVPPKKMAKDCEFVNPNLNTIAGRTATRPKKIAPGRVILDRIPSKNSAVNDLA